MLYVYRVQATNPIGSRIAAETNLFQHNLPLFIYQLVFFLNLYAIGLPNHLIFLGNWLSLSLVSLYVVEKKRR